ncbi:MAG TPA: 30S ribosomal protein S6 [Terriglobia bacterium]|nr:30S ribosomal protein S6 [Terriglobia bacterium]
MHKYEVMFILRTDVPEEENDKVISQLEGFAVAAAAKIEKIERLGRRRMAYRVRRFREGFYVLFMIEAEPQAVAELERRMKVMDSVVKFLTVRVDIEQKRAAKRVQVRLKKAARRKGPAHTAPQAAEATQA